VGEAAGKLYFSYAVFMNRGQMQQICPQAEPLGRAVLRGYRLVFPRSSGLWMGGVPSLEPCAGEEIWGVLWRLLNDCEARLNDYQGFHGAKGDNVFVPIDVEVEDAEGRSVLAFAYQAPQRNRTEFTPSPEFVDTVVRAARDFGLPEAYIARLERLA
jgi:hypothetical protein